MAAFLSHSQQWADYFSKRGVSVAFFSAAEEAERLIAEEVRCIGHPECSRDDGEAQLDPLRVFFSFFLFWPQPLILTPGLFLGG